MADRPAGARASSSRGPSAATSASKPAVPLAHPASRSSPVRRWSLTRRSAAHVHFGQTARKRLQGAAECRATPFATGSGGTRGFNPERRDECIQARGAPGPSCEPFEPGETVEFDPEVCGPCPLRANCTQATSGCGRTITMVHDEALQARFRKLQQTPSGRRLLRGPAHPLGLDVMSAPHASDTRRADPRHVRHALAGPVRRRRWLVLQCSTLDVRDLGVRDRPLATTPGSLSLNARDALLVAKPPPARSS